MERPPGTGAPLVVPGDRLRRLMGLWQPPDCVSWLVPSSVLAALTLACIMVLAVGVTLKLCADLPEELEQMTLCGLVASICVGFFCKAALFLVQADTLREAVRVLEDTRGRFCSSDSNVLTRRRYQTLSNNVYYYYQTLAVPAVLGWVISPMVAHTTKADQDHVAPHRTLPMPIWSPVDIYTSPTYEFVFFIQSFASLITSQCCLSIDIFFVHMMLMVAAELDVLNYNLCTMEHYNSQTVIPDVEEDISSFKRNNVGLAVLNRGQSIGEEPLKEDAACKGLHHQLLKNVLHHQAILRSVSLLQSAMNVSIFVLLFINMANLCSSLFVAAVLLQEDGNVGKALNALFCVPAIMYETTMYCMYAHIMTDQSERLMYSAFSCDWVNSDARFKRSLLIFMMVTVRPIEITVGKMCTLSKQMLLQVLNGSYALLNMLYHFH